jgi:hypothetical protein
MVLVTSGTISNILMYVVCIWVGRLGIAAIAAMVACGAIAFFLFVRLLLTSSPARPTHIILVGLVSALSVMVPGGLQWSFVGLFVAKGLWWIAVLGTCVASMHVVEPRALRGPKVPMRETGQ